MKINLLLAREYRGFSQQQLASLLEVRQQTLSEWENGLNKPSIKMFVKISKLLNFRVDYLKSPIEVGEDYEL